MSFKNSSRYWMVYLEMGLWLSAPRLHCSVTLLSDLSTIRTPPGAPGGPGVNISEEINRQVLKVKVTGENADVAEKPSEGESHSCE